MRTHKFLAAAVASLSLTLLSCTSNSSEPDIPADSTPNEVHDLVTSGDGQQTLQKITTYEWKDRGERVADLFSWVPEWANSTVPEQQEKAAQTAHALADFLAGNSAILLNLSRNDDDGDPSTIGALNPAIVQSYTDALIPFVDSMVGASKHADEFQPLDPLDSSFPKTHALFTVLGSTDASSLKLGTTIVELSNHYRDELSKALSEKPILIEEANAEVLRSARLLGLAISSGLQAPDSAPNIFYPEVARTELNFSMARASVTGPNDDIVQKYFAPNNTLMTPEYVRQSLGEAPWGEYSGMLGRYVARSRDLRGFSSIFSQTLYMIVTDNQN